MFVLIFFVFVIVVVNCSDSKQTCIGDDCEDQYLLHHAFDLNVWYHSGGGFEHKGDGKWVEDDGGLVQLFFNEVSRDYQKQEVIIFDPNRQLHIKLTPTMSYFQTGGDRELFRGSWAPLNFHYNGLELEYNDETELWKVTENGKEEDGDYSLLTESSCSENLVFHLENKNQNSPLFPNYLKISNSGFVFTKDSELQEWNSLGLGEWKHPKRHDIPKILNTPFKVYNPGQPIAMVTLSTANIASYAEIAEKNQLFYANKHGYTFYVYHDSLLEWNQRGGAWHSIVTWNKIRAVMDHLKDHEWVFWIDSDAIFLDLDKKIEDIIALAPSTKEFLVCKDPKDWLLNTGVMIFKNADWCHQMLERLWLMPKVHHSSGAEQNQLIKLLRHIDEKTTKWHLFPECTFNCHPDHYVDGIYVIHYMGLPQGFKIQKINEWNKKLGISD